MSYARDFDMPTMRYVVPGCPIPLQRPRYNGALRPYDAQKLVKQQWRYFLEQQHGSLPFYTGNLRLDCLFVFPIPRVNITKADQLIDTYHKIRPDISNLVKFVEDCCEGILYRDDCIVVTGTNHKIFGVDPCTIFWTTPLPDDAKYQGAR
jgi:Holliday junction resolvase RusA-like endonuclease